MDGRAGWHGKVVLEILRLSGSDVTVLDAREDLEGTEILGHAVATADMVFAALRGPAEFIVGIGAAVKEKIAIGPKSLIGAWAVVVEDVPPGAVAYGNPCRIIRRIECEEQVYPEDAASAEEPLVEEIGQIAAGFQDRADRNRIPLHFPSPSIGGLGRPRSRGPVESIVCAGSPLSPPSAPDVAESLVEIHGDTEESEP